MPDDTELTDRVVITSSDVASAPAADAPPSVPAPPPPARIPWWAATIASVLAICLPLLCLFALAMRIAMRQRSALLRARWNALLGTLLIASGLATSLGAGYVFVLRTARRQVNTPVVLGLLSHDWSDSFPELPVAQPMTPQDLVARMKPLIFIAMPDPGGVLLNEAYLATGPLGAAVMLMADDQGYLLATNRHVAEVPGFGFIGNKDRLLVISSQGSTAFAEIVARHQNMDLALLWVPRHGGSARFRQPITRYSKIAVGSPVFVIGHPQRLFFTLSSGLVSRLGGDNTVQLSAPISPGNSGGPAYDSLGNLVGVVTFTVDKEITPNAENLNFATRADAFLSEDGWTFRDDGKMILKRFIQAN